MTRHVMRASGEARSRRGLARITRAATDLPGGTVLTSYADASVLPRDLARPWPCTRGDQRVPEWSLD
jgi:hypothetical protein